MVMQTVSILALAALVIMGCGSGNGETGDAAQDEALTRTQTETPVDQTEAPVAKTAPLVEETPVVAAPPPRDDFAAAEARNTTASTTKPAVDTSQLKLAPAWELYDLEGKVVRSSDLEGKVVLVDFWATWCGPCKRSIPHLIKLHEEYADQGVVVLGVSLDRADPQKVVKPFVALNNINYQVLMGNMKIQQDFGGVRGIPTAFIISQDGKIYRKLVGLRPKEHYEEPIKALLGVS
jgi:thiol-disulfide isomerase/thioredoxin